MQTTYIPTVPYKLKNVFQSAGQDFSSGLSNWACETLIAPNEEGSIRCRFGRMVEDFAGWLFCICYPGSREEILAVINDEIPVKYMTPRQLEVHQRRAEWGFTNIDDINGGAIQE